MDQAILNASWIWLPQEKLVRHQYVCFRKSFPVTAPQGGVIDISADSDFVLFLNGEELGRGQFSDYPTQKTVSRFEVGNRLLNGNNTLAILAYYRGEDFSDHRAGQPGLIAALTGAGHPILTDASWKCLSHPAFAAGDLPKVTMQQGFTTSFDARLDLPWTAAGFDDAGWPATDIRASATGGYWQELHPRPVPLLAQGAPLAVKTVAHGDLLRKQEFASIAETMANDYTVVKPVDFAANPRLRAPHHLAPPVAPANGCFFMVDLGREVVGLIHFEIDAPDGAVLDFAHGEHLDDGRVRMHVGGRNFADRYICKNGRNVYTLPFRRIGGRYLQVHATNFTTSITVHYFGLHPLTLPHVTSCRFRTNDPLVNRMHEIGTRTLTLCMHEHYEDSPWREQALYAFDARNQALCGYSVFGNYDFAKTSFALLGRGIRKDGWLELCAPAKVSITIPIFSMVWISALAEHWLHSGSADLYETFSTQIASMIDEMMARQDKNTGLYRFPDAPDLWHFYEWTAGLSGLSNVSPGRNKAGELHAAYNLFFYEALACYSWMLGMAGNVKAVAGYKKIMDELAAAIHLTYWSDAKGGYSTVLQGGESGGAHQLIQALALANALVPPEKQASVLQCLTTQNFAELTLSSAVYLIKGLMAKGPAARKQLSEFIFTQWTPMVFAGATTFWETQRGAADFDHAGSLCHGWSALPIYYYHAYVLGIRPKLPGFVEFYVAPYSNGLFWAEGEVATPFGKIFVQWKKYDDGLDVTINHPAQCKPILLPFEEVNVRNVQFNGVPFRQHGDGQDADVS